MKAKAQLAALLVASSVAALGATQADAASPATAAFVANVRPNVDFLDTSSRLALTRSSSPRIRSFARREATEQTIAANSLAAYTSVNGPVVADAGVGGVLAPVSSLAVLPLNVATNVTTDVTGNVGNVLEGRSVAIDDNPLAPRVVAPQQPMAGGLLPSGANDLDRLRSLNGVAFDALYHSSQVDALRQLSILYRDYMRNGDDPALRAMARRELPKINRRLTELNAI